MNSALKNSAIDQKIEKLPTKSVLLVGFGGIDAKKKKCAKMKAPKANRPHPRAKRRGQK
jgi:hypothetical protein